MAAIVAVFGADSDPSLIETLERMVGTEPSRGKPSFVRGSFFALAAQVVGEESALVRTLPPPLALDSWVDGVEILFDSLGSAPSADDAATVTSRISGAFAFVMVNEADRRVYASCDLAGGRPLFFSTASRRLVLATTPRQVLAGASIPKRMNREVVAQYLANRPGNAGESIFLGVSRVHPGTVAEFEFDEGWKLARVRRWWDPRALSRWEGKQGEEAEALCEVLLGAIDRAVAGGSSAISLSGGKDSGSIWSLSGVVPAARDAVPISLVFEGLECDERRFLESYRAADRKPQVHVEAGATVPSEFLPFFIRSLGTIPYTTTHLFGILAQAAAREGRSLLLGGTGGDEWFTSNWPSTIRSAFSGSDRSVRMIRLLRVFVGKDGWWGRFQVKRAVAGRLKFLEQLRRSEVECVMSNPGREPDGDRDAPVQSLPRHMAGRLASLRRHQGGWVLDSLEGVAAAHGVQLRLPFMDREVIEFSLRMGPERFAAEGGDKGLLVAAVATKIPLPSRVGSRRRRTHFNCLVEGDESLNDLPGPDSWFLVREGVLDKKCLDRILRPEYGIDRTFALRLAWYRLVDGFLGRTFDD